MNEVITILGVALLFLVRIGIPIILLVCLGLLIDHWQSNREKQAKNLTRKSS